VGDRAVPGSGVPGCDRAPSRLRLRSRHSHNRQYGQSAAARAPSWAASCAPAGPGSLPKGSACRSTPSCAVRPGCAVRNWRPGRDEHRLLRPPGARQGDPSESLRGGLAGPVLRLGEGEHEHLLSLAALAARTAPEPPSAHSRTVRPRVKLLLGGLRPHPAYVASRTGDLLAADPSGMGLLAGIEDWPAKQRNIAGHVFLHPGARVLFPTGKTRSAAAWPGFVPWPAPALRPRPGPACRWPAPTPTPPT
jgi:hypothetical protein